MPFKYAGLVLAVSRVVVLGYTYTVKRVALGCDHIKVVPDKVKFSGAPKATVDFQSIAGGRAL